MPRPLKEIAKDVRSNWIPIHPEAEPFLAAMERLDHIRADRNADVKVLAQFRWAARKWGDLSRGRLRAKSISFSMRTEPHHSSLCRFIKERRCLWSVCIEGRSKAPGKSIRQNFFAFNLSERILPNVIESRVHGVAFRPVGGSAAADDPKLGRT